MIRTNNIFNYVGVFAATLLTTVSAVYIYSPILGSHAGEMSAKVSAVVNPVVSLTLDTDNLEFNIAPTVDGTFASDSITATVNTNAINGYELYFSSEDDETNMVHANESISDVIASDFEGTATSETMGANKWGYSLDNADFLKIPALSNLATLRDIDHMPDTTEQENTVYIGTKVSTELASGSYSKIVKFTVVAHENPIMTWSISNMQEMTPEICNAAAIGATGTLTDMRDGNTYTVTKLKDGKCWMTQNLRIGKDEPMTLHPSDTDIFSDYELPASSSKWDQGLNKDGVYVDETYGGYYTVYTATATEGSTTKTSGDVQQSICPKGWRLPTGGSDSEFSALYEKYNSRDLLLGEAGITPSGQYAGKVAGQGSTGSYMSSTIASASKIYTLIFDSTRVADVASSNKHYGYSVRCIAR